MAIAEVASQRATNATGSAVDSLTCAFPNNVTAGSCLIVMGGGFKVPAYTGAVITDTVSTVYTVVLGTGLTANHLGWIAYGLAPASGANTVTVNPTGGNGSLAIGIDEFTGVDVTALDVDGGTSTGSSTTPSDGLVTATDGALVLGIFNTDNALSTITAGSGYTDIYQQIATGFTGGGEFKIAAGAGAQTVNWTISPTRAWAAQTLALKAVVAASATRRRIWGGQFFRSSA